MEHGNWIAIDKRFVDLLPKDMEYTYLEAMVSYSVDRDQGKVVSISGYASLWRWSRNKVRHFISTIGKGDDFYADRLGTGKGHPVRFIFNNLQGVKDRLRTGEGHYYNPNPKKKKKDMSKSVNLDLSFALFWKQYPKHQGRKQAEAAWKKVKPDETLLNTILEALKEQKVSKDRLKQSNKFCAEWPLPATWLNGHRWEDEIEAQSGAIDENYFSNGAEL